MHQMSMLQIGTYMRADNLYESQPKTGFAGSKTVADLLILRPSTKEPP